MSSLRNMSLVLGGSLALMVSGCTGITKTPEATCIQAQTYFAEVRKVEGDTISFQTSDNLETRKWLATELVCNATRGDKAAQYELAMAHGAGLWTPQDLEQKVLWLKESAKIDPGTDLFYSPGHGDAPATVQPYQARTPDPGYAKAQFELGRMYLEGDGVKQSNRKARKWLEKAAQQGHAEAKILLERIEAG